MRSLSLLVLISAMGCGPPAAQPQHAGNQRKSSNDEGMAVAPAPPKLELTVSRRDTDYVLEWKPCEDWGEPTPLYRIGFIVHNPGVSDSQFICLVAPKQGTYATRDRWVYGEQGPDVGFERCDPLVPGNIYAIIIGTDRSNQEWDYRIESDGTPTRLSEPTCTSPASH